MSAHPRHWTRRRGYVYFLTDGTDIKIGFSTHVPSRLVQLSRQTGVKLELIAAAVGWKKDEARLHCRFERGHMMKYGLREWFKATPRLFSLIDQITDAERWIKSGRATLHEVITGKFRSIPMPKAAPTDTQKFLSWVKQNKDKYAGTEVERLLTFCELDAAALTRGAQHSPAFVAAAQKSFADLERAISAHR